MCGPRQLFFFQCGADTPKGWTPLLDPVKGVEKAIIGFTPSRLDRVLPCSPYHFPFHIFLCSQA